MRCASCCSDFSALLFQTIGGYLVIMLDFRHGTWVSCNAILWDTLHLVLLLVLYAGCIMQICYIARNFYLHTASYSFSRSAWGHHMECSILLPGRTTLVQAVRCGSCEHWWMKKARSVCTLYLSPLRGRSGNSSSNRSNAQRSISQKREKFKVAAQTAEANETPVL